MEWRIKLKIATFTFKVLETGLPPYLSQQLLAYAPSRGLRSSSSKLLQDPRTNLCFGSRSFHMSAPTIWNSLSFLQISNNVSETSQNTLFPTAFSATPSDYPAPQMQLFDLALYKST